MCRVQVSFILMDKSKIFLVLYEKKSFLSFTKSMFFPSWKSLIENLITNIFNERE